MAKIRFTTIATAMVCVISLMAVLSLVQQMSFVDSSPTGLPSSTFVNALKKRVASEHPTARHVLSPDQVGIPDGVSPEDFFEKTILPSLKSETGQQFVIDVGANVGQFATSIVKLGFTGVSFEPGPSTCETLKQNVKAAESKSSGRVRGRVRVVCAVVGGANGSAHFAMPKGTSDRSFSVVQRQSLDTVEVQVVTLDSEITPEQNVSLLKIDTQGHEVEVLAGARRLLESKQPGLLLIECSHILLTLRGSSPLQLMDLIASYGYVCVHLAFRGKNKWGQYDVKHLRKIAAHSRSFEELAALLAALPPDNLPGWTDLLCWDGSSATPLWKRPLKDVRKQENNFLAG